MDPKITANGFMQRGHNWRSIISRNAETQMLPFEEIHTSARKLRFTSRNALQEMYDERNTKYREHILALPPARSYRKEPNTLPNKKSQKTKFTASEANDEAHERAARLKSSSKCPHSSRTSAYSALLHDHRVSIDASRGSAAKDAGLS